MWGRAGLAAIAGATVLAGCSGLAPDPAAEAMAKQAYQRLIHREDAALEAMLIPAARNPSNTATYDAMRSLIPAGEPQSVTRVSWQTFSGTNGRQMTYQHAYAYPGRTVTAMTILVGPSIGGAWIVQSFKVNVSAAPVAPTGKPAS